MYASLLFTVATFVGGTNPQPPPPPIATVAVQATPDVPIHDGRPQEAEGQTAADAVIIPDDGYGFPVETGPAEIGRLGGPRDLSDLTEICGVKPWLCDDSYS
jgi:hypothetical protein